MKDIFFKSDFKLKTKGETYNEYPFEIKFWTDKPNRTYIASYDGDKYHNCRYNEVDDSLSIFFDNHGLGVGVLKAAITFHIPDNDYPDGYYDTTSVGYYDLRLTIKEVAMGGGGSADEISVEFIGAEIRFINASATIYGEEILIPDIEANISENEIVINL